MSNIECWTLNILTSVALISTIDWHLSARILKFGNIHVVFK